MFSFESFKTMQVTKAAKTSLLFALNITGILKVLQLPWLTLFLYFTLETYGI
jgi:hypothetical protein